VSERASGARGWCGLAFAAAVYVALRALVLYTAFDQVAMTQYEMFPMGTIPRIACVEGGLPVAKVYDNAAGQLLTGVLAIPSYALVGPSFLALKLVPFALGLGALAVVWALLREHFDARAASFGALLFAVGLYMSLAKRNFVGVLMGIELMLNAVNLTFVAFSRFVESPNPLDGHVFVVFVVTVAAAEAATALAIAMLLYRVRDTIEVDEINLLKW